MEENPRAVGSCAVRPHGTPISSLHNSNAGRFGGGGSSPHLQIGKNDSMIKAIAVTRGSQNPTVILQNSQNVQKELDGGEKQKEVLPFFSFLFKTQAFQRLLICAFLCFSAPFAACLSTSCSCWLGQELKCDCLSLGYPEWFHVKSYVLFSPNFLLMLSFLLGNI